MESISWMPYLSALRVSRTIGPATCLTLIFLIFDFSRVMSSIVECCRVTRHFYVEYIDNSA